MNIAIVGTGCVGLVSGTCVGLVSGTCFAEMGAHVTCVDVDAQKIKYDTNLSPVIRYFVTLLRYIHQNPTKAGVVSKVGDYDWSSWKEYTSEIPAALGLCATNAILKRMSFEDLKELVEAPLDDDVQCLELDETVKVTVGDREVRQHLLEHFDISDSIKVQTLDKELRNEIIISCLELGTGLRQLSRLTGVTYGVINRINNKKLRD